MAGERRIPPLRLEIWPSRILAWLLGCAHALAAGAVMVAVPQWHLRALAMAALVLSASLLLRRHALLRDPRAVTALELDDECACTLVRRDGSRARGHVLGSSHVFTWLMVLHVRAEGARMLRYVVLMNDSAETERLRRLRVRLRYGDLTATRGRGENASL